MSGINGRMIAKNAYSHDTLKTFSFISAYFIELFYNDLYTQAERYFRNKQTTTITDGYLASLDAFLQSINQYDGDLFTELVHGIHKKFQDYGFKGLSYPNCIDRIIKEFVPQDYWSQLSFDDKSKLLGTIITNSTNTMIRDIISNRIPDVIDNHGEEENGNIWQDAFIDILIFEREKLYHEFINVKTNSLSSDNSLINTMKQEILLLSQQKNSANQEMYTLKKENLHIKKVLLKVCRDYKDAQTQLTQLQEQLETVVPAKGPVVESHVNITSENSEYQNKSTNNLWANNYHTQDLNSDIGEIDGDVTDEIVGDVSNTINNSSKQIYFDNDDDLYQLE